MTLEQETPHPAADISLYAAGRRSIRASVLIGWANALLGAGAVLTIASAIDHVIGGENATVLLIWLTVVLVLRALVAAAPPVLSASTASHVESDLRNRLIDSVLRVGPWSGRRTGETVARATEGVEAVGALAGTFLPQLVAGMSTPLLLAMVVAFVDWPTAVVLVVVLPLIPLLLRLLEKRFASVSARYRATEDQLAARFLDGIQGLRTLKALDRADDYGDELAADAERLRAETMRLLRVNQLALLAVDTLFTAGTVVAAAAMAAVRLGAGAITVGQAVAIVLLGVMLIEPLSQIGRFFYVGAIGRASAAEIKSFLTSAGRTETSRLPTSIGESGSVSFDSVTFTYPDGTEALHDLNLSIAPGERVALVGPSGSGKTTLAHMILGLLQPSEGLVRVGGPAVLVPQRPYLFHGTVAFNLSIAKPNARDAQLWAALEAAQMAEMLADRKLGLDSPVGERGLDLSGGEVQRLAIARALLVDAPVVVLDEPTSNVDLESEARLRQAIDKLTEGRTLIVIAHRWSTIAGMDRVVVLDEGRLERNLQGGDISELLATIRRST